MNEVMEQPIKKEDQLLQDMKKLYLLQQEVDNLVDSKEELTESLTEKEPDLMELLANNDVLSKEFKKRFNDLKANIGKRGIEICEDSDRENKKPALGVQITENENRLLNVDEEEAVKWCIEKNHWTLLQLIKPVYAAQVAIGTIPDMPGEVDDTKILKAKISLKPFAKEEDNG